VLIAPKQKRNSAPPLLTEKKDLIALLRSLTAAEAQNDHLLGTYTYYISDRLVDQPSDSVYGRNETGKRTYSCVFVSMLLPILRKETLSSLWYIAPNASWTLCSRISIDKPLASFSEASYGLS